jgi:hypothetical protein
MNTISTIDVKLKRVIDRVESQPLCPPVWMYLTFVPSFGRVFNGFGRILVAVTVNHGGFEGTEIFRIRRSPITRENVQISFE